MAELSDVKLPLPTFLKVLTANGVPAARAIAITGKMFVFLLLMFAAYF